MGLMRSAGAGAALTAALLALAGPAPAAELPGYACVGTDARGRAGFPGADAAVLMLEFTGPGRAADAALVLAERLAARGILALTHAAPDAPRIEVVIRRGDAGALPDLLAPGELSFHLVHYDAAPGAGRIEIINRDGERRMIEEAPYLTGASVASAEAGTGTSGEPVVELDLDRPGARILAEVSAANIGRDVAIVVDGVIVMEPRIVEPITGGKLALSGSLTAAGAEALAAALASGPLPTGMTIVNERAACPGEGN